MSTEETGYKSLRDTIQVPLGGYGVAQWCPTDDGERPTEVHLHFEVDGMPEVMFAQRFKSMRAVKELVDTLMRHAKEVFREEAK